MLRIVCGSHMVKYDYLANTFDCTWVVLWVKTVSASKVGLLHSPETLNPINL